MGSKKYKNRDSYDSYRSRSRRRHHKDKHKNRKRSYSYSEERNRKYERSNRHKNQKRYRDQSRKRKYQSSSSYSPSRSATSKSRSPSGEHYRFKVGQYLGKQYKIRKLLGDGTFGRVVEAQRNHKTYAVKIIKSVERYIDSAKTQKKIIKYVNSKDPDDKQGIVRYVQSFDHYKNYCIVFKPLGKSLYDVIKSNNHKGFPIHLVKSFFKQILRSVGFLHHIGYTHTDLKPENVLLEKNKFIKQTYPSKHNEENWISLPEDDKVRIIDFGGATQDDDHHSRIINTRQYRSPEVILQSCKWHHQSDVWSIGCIIVQLYTGQLYFSTHENVQHLKMIEKHNKRPLPLWMTENSQEFRKYFINGELDWPKVASGKQSIRAVEEMATIDEIMKPHEAMLDLLRRCLEVDPRRRITCAEALKHRFFQES